jgi:hypothetical protein
MKVSCLNCPGCKVRRVLILLGFTCLCPLLTGCRQRTAADYTPSQETCRQALIVALDAWKRGEPPGRIEGTPAVQVGDTLRRAGQKLASYEILGELGGDQGRQFSVLCVLENPAAEEKINFILIGIDPIWVFRQEEYDMVTHWEHKMTPEDNVKGQDSPQK